MPVNASTKRPVLIDGFDFSKLGIKTLLSDEVVALFSKHGYSMVEVRGAINHRCVLYAWGYEVGSIYTSEETITEAVANGIAQLGGSYEMAFNRSGRVEANLVARCRLTNALHRKLLPFEDDEL